MKFAKYASLIVVTSTLLTLSSYSTARIKCWVNSDGVRECGEKVPPEYAQKGHKEMSKHGVTVDESERAKTKEELEEEKRLAAIQAEKDKQQAEKDKQDQILLATYSNTDDIQLTSDGKIAAIESDIKLADKRNEKIQADLDKRTATAAAEELAGKQPSEDLLKDISSLQRQINNNDKFIADKRAEQEEIKKEYAAKIARFKELKGIE